MKLRNPSSTVFKKKELGSTSGKKTNIPSKSRFNERFPNDNIFKNDIKYKINKYLGFDSLIENSNIFLDLLRRKYDGIKIGIILYSLKIAISLNFQSFFFSILSLIQLFLIIISIYLILHYENPLKNCFLLSETEKNFRYLRIILEIISSIDIYKIIEIHEVSITFENCSYFLIFPVLFNIFLITEFKQSLLFYTIQLILMMIFLNHPQYNYVIRFFCNLFSLDLILLLSVFFPYVFFEYILKRGYCELWALYDSFKRSYNTAKKCMFDDIPNPIFIISRKSNNLIQYKNNAADKLYDKISKNSQKKIAAPNRKFSYLSSTVKKNIQTVKEKIYSLSNLFDRDMEELFNRELENCLTFKKNYFYFPFRINEKDMAELNYKENTKRITFYEGDLECFEWYQIIISPCVWKSQESVHLQLIKNIDFYKEDFISNYLGNISCEFNSLIENVDKICDNIVEADNIIEKFEKSIQILQNMNNTPGPITRNLSTISPVAAKPVKTLGRGNTLVLGMKPTRDTFRPRLNYPFYNHSLWFFFKYNSNLLYDLFISMKIFNEISSHTYYKANYKLANLRSFLSYFDNNFYIISRLKNINIKSNIYAEDSTINLDAELIVNHEYFRVIFFNIYNFFLNNTNDNSEKDLMIDISIERNQNFVENKKDKKESLHNENDLVLNISVMMEDPKPKYNFNQINLLLSKFTHFNNPIFELNFIKLIDCGFVIIYMISKLIYEGEFLISKSENNQTMNLKILAMSKDLFKKIQYNPKDFINKKYIELKEDISEDYYIKILKETYKCVVDPKLKKIPHLKSDDSMYSINDKEETNTGLNGSSHGDLYSNESDSFDDTEEETIFEKFRCSLNFDKEFVNQLKFDKQFKKCDTTFAYDFFDPEAIKKKILQKSKELKIYPSYDKIKRGFIPQEMWDFGSLRSSVKYFFPPRFLIVEDNVAGRSSIIKILKQQKLDYLYDVAAYGKESVQKFKFFLNKGFIYDIVFMDINLPDMLGSEATTIMREYESEYSCKKTTIVAVSVEGKKNIKMDNLFDDYYEKPVKPSILKECINKHFQTSRPNLYKNI